jgi:hypothetical protein
VISHNPWNYSAQNIDVYKEMLNLMYDKVDINVKNIRQLSYMSHDPATPLEASIAWKDESMYLFDWLTHHPQFSYNLTSNDVNRIFSKVTSSYPLNGYKHYYPKVVDFLLPLMTQEHINSAITALIHNQKENTNFTEFKSFVDPLKFSPHFKINKSELQSFNLSLDIFLKKSFSTNPRENVDEFYKYLEALHLESNLNQPIQITKTQKMKI